MLRKILFVLFVVLVLGGVGYTFLELSKAETTSADPWELVPANAAMIWQHEGLPDTWQRISSTNLIWANLQKAPFFAALDSSMLSIQLHFEADAEWQKDLSNSQVLVSAHMVNLPDRQAGGNDFDFLYLFSLPEKIAEENRNSYLKEHLQKAPNGSALRERNAEALQFFKLPSSDGSFTHFTQVQGVVLASATLSLIEDALEQFESGNSIDKDLAFRKVQRTAGTGKDGSIYLQSQQFDKIIASFLSPDHKKDPATPGNWIELDVDLKPNKLFLAGMVDTTTNSNALVAAALSQKARKSSIAELAPPNTAAMFSMALSNGASLLEHLEQSGARDPDLIRTLNDSLNTDLDMALLSWIDKEVGKIVVVNGNGHGTSSLPTGQAGGAEMEPREAYIFNTSSEDKASRMLDLLAESISAFTGKEEPSIEHLGISIQQLAYPGLHKAVLGNTFSELLQPYYMVLDGRVVFSTKVEVLQSIINHYIDRTTLNTDLAFLDLNDNTSERSNLYCYISLPRYRPLLAEFLSKENADKSEEWSSVWNDMGAMVLQMTASGNGMSFINIALRSQPAELKESSTLWEAQLAAPLTLKPQLLKDHNSGALDIFVQDSAQNIYLFSNTGKELWRSELSGRIIGDVHQIDRYRNGKLQMLFNTAEKIYLLDRNGHNVEGFPITLPTPATATLAVFDYDKDRKYRILIPCENKELHMYGMDGKAVNGWKNGGTKALVQHTPVHIRIHNKDYIYCFDTLGNQYVLDRQGKTRYKASATMPLPTPTNPIIQSNSKIGGTKVLYNTSELLIEWTIDGALDTVNPELSKPLKGMTLADVTGDGEQETVLTTATAMTVIQGTKPLLSEIFDHPILYGPMRFNFNDGDKVGVANASENGVWLFDALVGALPNMPLKGNTAFSIGDLNRDGKFELVVGTGSGVLLVHQLR